MTTSGDPRALAAAAKIADVAAGLGAAGRRAATDGFRDCPALATDPRLAGPALVDAGPAHRRTAQLLTAAGGDDLQDAAKRLADWVGPVVALTDLESRLEVWLPVGIVPDRAAVLTRRLLCDTAGLARTPWSIHAVSIAALEVFAAAAMDAADDAELIDEDSLSRAAAQRGWDSDVVEALCGVCGFERLFDSLAVRRNRLSLCKAALLDLGRSASRHEVAELTGLASAAVGMALSTCGSVVRTGYGRWAAHRDPSFVQFAEAAAAEADDVGLINEQRLKRLAEARGWGDSLAGWIAYAGYVRLNNQLAMSATHNARVKAAVTHHGGSASIDQVAETAQLSVQAATAAARNIASLRLAKGTCRVVAPPRPRLVELARANSDDVGVVDVDRFAADAATYGYEGTVDELAEWCGLVELSGRLALHEAANAAVKAALLGVGRPASTAELATLTGRTPKAVSHALVETPSIVRTGPRWVVDTSDGALGEFAGAAADTADDVGLVNETQLREIAAQRGWSDRFDRLAEAGGLARVEGRLALDSTRKAAVKAALLNLGRPATPRELAAAVGMTSTAVVTVLTSIASVTRIRSSVWAAQGLNDGAFDRFAAALQLCSDDAGLINETQLRKIAQQQRWKIPVDELIRVCGLPRLHGSLAMDATAAAAAKAALVELGRPATLHELADITGHHYGTIRSALTRVGSVQRITRGARAERGLLAVTDPEDPPR